MGQGQAEIAMQLLKQCAQEGEWLCLKNLHLMSDSLLFLLEKEINGLKPHDNFRLWLTAEVHPKFPTILLQSSLKITYEVRQQCVPMRIHVATHCFLFRRRLE